MADNNFIKVGGRLHSIATGNVVAGANEIFDDDKGKKQSDINTETYSLVNDVNERLNGLSPDQQSALSVATKATNNEIKLGYYVCDTPAARAEKAVSATGYVLTNGGSMKIKMTNDNTANDATLNINSTGAKALFYAGERASANNSWEAGETVEVYYDGTSFYANNVAGGSGSGDGAFDISAAHSGATYDNLAAALGTNGANVPASKRKGGMSVKFIQNIYATYSVVKTEGLDTEPTGTELQSASAVVNGIYTAAQLSNFNTAAPLPATVGSSVTYYFAVSTTEIVEGEEVTTTTYTKWVVTKATDDSGEYVQYMYTKASIANDTFTNTYNWKGIQEKYLTYWNNAYELRMGEGGTAAAILPYLSFSKSKYRIVKGASWQTKSRVRLNKSVKIGESIYVYALINKASLTNSNIDLSSGVYPINSGVQKNIKLVRPNVYFVELALLNSQSAYGDLCFYLTYTAADNWGILGLRTSTERLIFDETKLGMDDVYNSIVTTVRKNYTMPTVFGSNYRGLYRSLNTKLVDLYPVDIIRNGIGGDPYYTIGINNIVGGVLSVSFISNYSDYTLINYSNGASTRFQDSAGNHFANNYNLQEIASGIYLISITFRNLTENTSGVFYVYFSETKNDRTIINVNIKCGIEGVDGVYDKELPEILDKIKAANIEIINRDYCDYRLYRNIHARVYGDSIDAGGKYWEALGNKFCWQIENYAIGGAVCLWSNDTSFYPNQEINDFRIKTAWSCTQAEKEAMCAAWQAYTGRSMELTDAQRAVCYDNSVLGNNDDVDLFIIGDYGGNNDGVFPTAYLTDNEYITDRTTVMGALGYVINKLMDYTNTANGSKPNAKVLLMGQTNHCNGTRIKCDEIKKKVENIWGAKFVAWWEFLSINSANLSYYSPDGLHITTTKGFELTSNRITKAIRSVQDWLLAK